MGRRVQPDLTRPAALTQTLPPQLAFQRIRELQSAIEDGRLAGAAKDARIAELEGELAAVQVGPCDDGAESRAGCWVLS